MITCRFHGQLGNNLFQLAALLSLKEQGKEIFLLNSVHRGNIDEINDFKIHPKELEIKQMFNYKFNFMEVDVFNNFYHDKFKILNHPDLSNNVDFGFNQINQEDFTIINGYFQSEKYFISFAKNLKYHYFTPSESVINNISKKYDLDRFYNSVSLHYRRGGDRHIGDMQEYFKDLEFEYYREALSRVESKAEVNRIYVFSDDIPWCKENQSKLIQSDKEVVFIEGNKNYEDLFLMSMCDHNIIANSTFSWWSAWLNKNDDKIIVAPKTDWFGPKLRHMNLNDLFPNKWITL